MENKKWIVFKNKKGFTLIEMLIVIVIIGILAAAIIPRLNSARGRANDVARKADLNQVATALITYQLDTGGFPTTGTTLDQLSGVLVAGGMTSIPRDPANPNLFSGVTFSPGITPTPGQYVYVPIIKNGINGGGFVLMAQMESHGQSNYLICDANDIIGSTSSIDSYDEIKLCSTITNDISQACGSCNASDLSQLRYIYKY